MNWRSLLPEKKVIILMVALALVNPLHYAILSMTTPQDRVFVGHVDDILQLTMMGAISYGFEDPWYFGNVFSNPVIGAPFVYTLIGTPVTLLGMNSLLTFLVIKFFIALAFLAIVYNIMRFFLKEDANLGFLLFCFAAGVGWILYGVSFFMFGQPYTPIAGYLLTSEFTELGGGAHGLQHLTRIYWMVGEIAGFAAMLLFFGGRRLLAGFALGLSTLFYPLFGLGFAAFITLYALVTERGVSFERLKTAIMRLLPVALVAAPFGALWLLVYLSNPSSIELYRAEWSGFNSRPLLTLIVSSFFGLAFACYYWLKKERKQIAVLGLLALFFIPLTLANIYEYISRGHNILAKEWFAVSGLEGISAIIWKNSLPLEIAFFGLLTVLGYQVYSRYKEKSFPFLWILLIAFMSTVSARWVPWWPARYGWFMLYPVAIAAVPGIKKFVMKYRCGDILTIKRLTLAILLLSFPSVLAFNVHFYQTGKTSEYPYIAKADFEALQFLKDQPPGRVMAWYPVDQIVPYFTNHKSVLIAPLPEQRTEDVMRFYSGNISSSEMRSIIDRYNVKYVFLGEHEKKLGAKEFQTEFLEKIYNMGTMVYSVKS